LFWPSLYLLSLITVIGIVPYEFYIVLNMSYVIYIVLHIVLFRILYQEIDYINEGKNADRFRRDFRNIKWVRVPVCFLLLYYTLLDIFIQIVSVSLKL